MNSISMLQTPICLKVLEFSLKKTFWKSTDMCSGSNIEIDIFYMHARTIYLTLLNFLTTIVCHTLLVIQNKFCYFFTVFFFILLLCYFFTIFF